MCSCLFCLFAFSTILCVRLIFYFKYFCFVGNVCLRVWFMCASCMPSLAGRYRLFNSAQNWAQFTTLWLISKNNSMAKLAYLRTCRCTQCRTRTHFCLQLYHHYEHFTFNFFPWNQMSSVQKYAFVPKCEYIMILLYNAGFHIISFNHLLVSFHRINRIVVHIFDLFVVKYNQRPVLAN